MISVRAGKLLSVASFLLVPFFCTGAEVNSFESTDLSEWTAWTNDENPESRWEVVDSALLQRAPNSDDKAWGDRYLIRDFGSPLLSSASSVIDVNVDMLLNDYRGGIGSWQGIGLFIDPSNPTASGAVFVTLEKADKLGINGLRVHCGGWASELIPYERDILEWHRLTVTTPA